MSLLGVASGQVRPWDFTKRNSRLEGKRFETTTMATPQGSDKWKNQKFNTANYDTYDSRFSGDQFKVETTNLYQSSRFNTTDLDFEQRDFIAFRQDDKMFSEDELDRIKFNTLHHDAKKDSMVAKEGPALNIQEVLDQLSLADLNRYQFRSSRSDDPVLPVQQAASEKIVTAEAVE
tara:strand:+ start:14794 stop:15321 length:528 start_codon:yes stop_codon:yes gene_type:complete